MRVVVVYKEQTDYARTVVDYMWDLEHQTGHSLEVINPDTPDGAHFCETYGILQYPAIIALKDYDGQMEKIWSGLPLPTIMELSYYV